MAHEGLFGGDRGQTDYWVAIEQNDSGTMKVYDAAAGSNTFAVWDTADQDDYDITPTEASPGKYTFTFPADITAGDYTVTVRKGSKADADETAGVTHCESVHWDGTILTINANTAVLSTAAITSIWAKAMSDLAQGAPSATASVLIAINYLYEALRNVTKTTATEFAIYKDDGTTKAVKATLGDDGSTFTKGELGSGA